MNRHVDEILHELCNDIDRKNIVFFDGVKTKDMPYKYHYCQDGLYLVQHDSGFMIFVEATKPDTAILFADKSMKGKYDD